ncbi:Gluconate 2-dehydrogenase subunit 3 precursor [compost metagenome]
MKTHGKVYAELDKALQEQILKDLQGNKIKFESVPATTFFNFLLANAKEGFFADPIYGGNKNMVGWKMVGFPGARADFMDWTDQPNVKYPYGPVSISGEKG